MGRRKNGFKGIPVDSIDDLLTADGVAEETDESLLRVRAHEIFRRRVANNTPGDDITDWLEAEREVRASRLPDGRRDPSIEL